MPCKTCVVGGRVCSSPADLPVTDTPGRSSCSVAGVAAECMEPASRSEDFGRTSVQGANKEMAAISHMCLLRSTPPAAVRRAVARRIKEEHVGGDEAEYRRQRSRLHQRLSRLKTLFLLGDLTENQFLYERQCARAELEALEPRLMQDAAEAAGVLMNFALFWEHESDGHERNKLLRVMFESISVDDKKIVAVTPRRPFLPYFQFGKEATGGKERERRDSNPRPPA
jgi:hypothetical protein